MATASAIELRLETAAREAVRASLDKLSECRLLFYDLYVAPDALLWLSGSWLLNDILPFLVLMLLSF